MPSNGRRISESAEGVRLVNPHIQEMGEDYLYHLSLGSGTNDLKEMFGDVRFVCMGGTPHRMKEFAHHMASALSYRIPTGTQLHDIIENSHRYAMYKVGPVLSISHGMGMSSAGILLHEVIKLMYHAGVKNPIFFRIGTSGGIGLEPGTVVVTEEVVDGQLRSEYEMIILGEKISRHAHVDQDLVKAVLKMGNPDDHFQIVKGKTISTNDFYEGQGRIDGAVCEYNESDKMAYLQKVSQKGVVNMEMEALIFAALSHKAGIRCATVCVTLLDRLKGDQITTPKAELLEWQERPMKIVERFILSELKRGKSNHCNNSHQNPIFQTNTSRAQPYIED